MTTLTDTAPSPTALIGNATLVELVKSARAGDERAWSQLVQRLEPRLRATLRTYRLPSADVEDVLQTTWMLLYRHIERIREPAAVAAWLITTVRREALAFIASRTHEWLTDDPELGVVEDCTPESKVLDAERRDAFVRALSTLPSRQRRVVTMLAVRPSVEYVQLASLLAMPAGSIGPTRARGLARLAQDPDLRSVVLTA